MNKWIDPKFWNHPTPVNLLLLTIAIVVFMYAALWLIWLIVNIFRILPLPVF